MRKFLLLYCFLGCFAQPIFAQNTDWREKIDPRLWQWAQQPDSAVEFLIILKNQADLTPAKQLHTKAEKGQFVYETLSKFAEKDQRDLRDLLQNESALHHSFWIINAVWAKGTSILLEKIAKMPEVSRLELNPIWHLSMPPQDSATVPSLDRSSLPWGITKINADDVWNQGFTGDGIVMGGQDTGFEWEHPAIQDRYRGWNGSVADHNYNWHDAIRNLIGGGPNSCGLDLDEPCDDHNHGTHTVGTMLGNENGENIGVAPGATWMGCRNMEEGDGTPATYIECFEWFVAPTDLDNNNANPGMAPHVINNSWGCPPSEGCDAGNFADMDAVVQNVRAAGIFVVVSAGNDGPNCSTVANPAAIYDASFSVGATNNGDNIANFSSRGPVNVYTPIMKPDISAPGVGVYSCIGNSHDPGSYGYASWNGTSMAGPHIAGVAALIMSARPDLIGDIDAIEDLMRANAVPRFAAAPFCGGDNANSLPNNVFGWGRVDALAAINAALPVQWLAFAAQIQGSTSLLRWSTATEHNCDFFAIQRSINGLNWQTIGQVACRGNNQTSETQYQFTDPQPLKGLNYYRLEQTDFSGETAYTPVRVLSFARSGFSLQFRATPGQAFFEVIGENADERDWFLEIRSADGRVLQSTAVGYKGWLQLPNAPPGVYVVLLRDAAGQVVALEKWWWMG